MFFFLFFFPIIRRTCVTPGSNPPVRAASWLLLEVEGGKGVMHRGLDGLALTEGGERREYERKTDWKTGPFFNSKRIQ